MRVGRKAAAGLVSAAMCAGVMAMPVSAASAAEQAYIAASNVQILNNGYNVISYAEAMSRSTTGAYYTAAQSYQWDAIFTDASAVDLAEANQVLANAKALGSDYLTQGGTTSTGIYITEYTVPNHGFNETFTYDAAGNVTSVTGMEIPDAVAEGDGQVSYYYGTDPEYYTYNYTYEADGLLASSQCAGYSYTYDNTNYQYVYGPDTYADTYTYARDSAGLATSRVSVMEPENPAGFTYDSLGRITDLSFVSSSVGNCTYHFSYKNNRIVTFTYTDETGYTLTTTFNYDANKRLVSAADSVGRSFVFIYDDAGRLIESSEQTPYTGPSDDMLEDGYTTKYYTVYTY